MTLEQQSQLDAEALAAADPEMWETCRGKPALERMFRRTVRQDHIRTILEWHERQASR